jgi:hypothetical protein
LEITRSTLAEVHYALPNLEPKTLRTYESLWDRHVLPNIGGVELRQLRPAVLDRFLAQLQRDGLSPASVKKVAGMVQGVLQRAVEGERIAQNPSAKRQRDVSGMSAGRGVLLPSRSA